MTIRRLTMTLAALIVLIGGGYWLWTTQISSPAEPTPTPHPIIEPGSPDTVLAEGVVVPAQRAQLGFTLNGRLEEWVVAEGERVEAGTVLARIFAPEITQSVPQAEAALAVAEANLAQATAGTRSEDVDAAQAALASADAQVEAAEAQEAQAQARLAEAQAALAEAERGPTTEQIRIAEARRKQAESSVKQAQAAYDQVKWRDDIAALPQSEALEQATLALEIATAEYQQVIDGATEEQLDQLRAGVQQAADALQQARANVDAAVAARTQAEANLRRARNGPTEEDIAVLEAQVQQAQASLERAREMEAQTELRAPFAGTLAQRLIETGEPVAPNQPAARFGNLRALQVETDDLNEIDVGEVRAGQPADVTFDALPNVTATGTVASVRPVAETNAGETTYTVTVEFDTVPEGARWGMTAIVEIQIE